MERQSASAARDVADARPRRSGVVLVVAGAFSLVALLLLGSRTPLVAETPDAGSSPAAAAPTGGGRIYWTTLDNTVRFGSLDGSGSATTLFRDPLPGAIAIYPAGDKLYWGSLDSGSIRVASLDGFGSPATLFEGSGHPVNSIAIDPAGGKIYWTGDGAVWVGNLDGSGSPKSLFSGEVYPDYNTDATGGIAIDPAAGKIYWVGRRGIRVGNMDGSGSAKTLLSSGFDFDIAIDTAAGKVYGGTNDGRVVVGNLDGSGSAKTLFGSEEKVTGVAIDPTAGKIYWAVDTDDGRIRVGNLDGSGSAATLFAGEHWSVSVAVLRPPLGTGPPVVSGGSEVGAELSCSPGTWAADLEGAFYYRAPQFTSYQWQQDGEDVGGAIHYTPEEPGQYTCTETASNQAGATSQTSAAVTVHAATPVTTPTATPTATATPIPSAAPAPTPRCAKQTVDDQADPGQTLASGGLPSARYPGVASVQTPTGGEVSITAVTCAMASPPAGYDLLGVEFEIGAPPASAADPLVIIFRLHPSLLEGLSPAPLSVLRNGTPVADCVGADLAEPDPCMTGAGQAQNGDRVISVLSSQGSTWNVARQAAPRGALPETATGGDEPAPQPSWLASMLLLGIVVLLAGGMLLAGVLLSRSRARR